jgi:hypothetical protein
MNERMELAPAQPSTLLATVKILLAALRSTLTVAVEGWAGRTGLVR